MLLLLINFIIQIFLIVFIIFSSLFLLIYVLIETKPIHRDRYVSGPFKLVTDNASLNYVSSRFFFISIFCRPMICFLAILMFVIIEAYLDNECPTLISLL